MIRETYRDHESILVIQADNAARHELALAYRGESPGLALSGCPAAEMLLCDWGYNGANGGLQFMPPERIPEAMTDMPLLADWTIEDDDGTSIYGKVYGFLDYCLTDPWAKLRDIGRVEFACVADYGDGARMPPVGSENWLSINGKAFDLCLTDWSPAYPAPVRATS